MVPSGVAADRYVKASSNEAIPLSYCAAVVAIYPWAEPGVRRGGVVQDLAPVPGKLIEGTPMLIWLLMGISVDCDRMSLIQAEAGDPKWRRSCVGMVG